MKHIFFFLLLLCVAAETQAQVKFKVGKIEVDDKNTKSVAGGPPDIYAQISFKDENNNGILENRESAIVTVKLMNKGIGDAQEMRVSLVEESENPDPNIYIEKEKQVKRLQPKQEATLTFKILAGKKIKSAVRKFSIKGIEKEGYDMETAYLELSTQEFEPPKLQFSGLEIIERGEGLYAKKNDGLLEKGERVKVRVVVQNVGLTGAIKVKYNIATNSENIKLSENAGEIGDIKSGDVKELSFIVSPTMRVESTGDLPIYLTLEDEPKDGVLKSFQLPIQLDQKPAEPKLVSIEGKPSQQKQVTRIQFTGKKSSALTDGYIDIKDVPPSKNVNPNAIAVVIGIEDYQNVPSAPYAANDAEIMRRYFENRFGIDREKILFYTNNQVQGIFFKKLFDPEKGTLATYVKPKETDIYVFYSGHGMPNKSADQTFLFPVDGDKEFLEESGYPIQRFYENLNKLNAKSVTVILDACFSGASRASAQIKEQNLIAAKGIKLKVTKPWLSYKNFTVINSSTGEETSLGFDESETGLFTYFLAAGLRGEADKDKNKEITLGELKEYVTSNVTAVSRRISGTQTPEFDGDPNRVMVKY